MAILNDGQPCWIYTDDEYDAGGTQIARKVTTFPVFTRDIILFGSEYGNIVHSWNFGHPQVIYSPDTYTTQGDSIYDVAWKNYIRDLYSVDTRKLTCYVRAEMDDRPWPYWLRRFYWFNNAIWRLNEIKDLNLCAYDTTKMEFIKVQDIENYKLDKIEYQGRNELVLDSGTVHYSGGTITGKVILQGAGGWVAGDYLRGTDEEGHSYYLDIADVMTPWRGTGQAVTPFTINVPANTGQTRITWDVLVIDDFDERYWASFEQSPAPANLYITPTEATVGISTTSYRLTVTGNTNFESMTFTNANARIFPVTAQKNGNYIDLSFTGNSGRPRTTRLYFILTDDDGNNFERAFILHQNGR